MLQYNTLEGSWYYLVSYAQNREDLYLRALFGEDYKGFYIDVGANHPIHHSVTKLLYRAGWHGINIDPNAGLMAMMAYDRPLDINLHCGVSDKPGKLTFRQYRNAGLSTFSTQLQHEYSKQSSEFTDVHQDIEVPVRTLADICNEHKVKQIDVLKVDVEGFEQQVLAGNDWKRFRPKVICIESNHKLVDWHIYLSDWGYQKKTTDGLNDYYIDEACELADSPLRFAETALAFPHIVDNDVAGYIALQELRVTVSDILSKAMRPAGREASVGLLKETIKLSIDELKALVKRRSRPQRTGFVPARALAAPKTMEGIVSYVRQANEQYDASYEAIGEYEASQVAKTRAGRMALRIKLAGYEAPRLVLGEGAKIVRRRLR